MTPAGKQRLIDSIVFSFIPSLMILGIFAWAMFS